MATVESSIDRGSRYPYDASDAWWVSLRDAPPPADRAHIAARAIVANLQDRHTIKHGFDGVDEATRAEIVATLAEIIRQVNAMDFPFMEAPS